MGSADTFGGEMKDRDSDSQKPGPEENQQGGAEPGTWDPTDPSAQYDDVVPLHTGEVEILDEGFPRSYSNPGAGPGYSIGRVFEDLDAKNPELRQITDITDEEHQHLDALAADPVLAWAEGRDPL